MKTKIFDIIIVGAGPAGTTCALRLKDSKLKVALIDKAQFPRDKICGDAIPGPSFKVMNSISSDLGLEMDRFPKSQNITTSKIVAPNNKSFTIKWFTKSYNSKRIDFDYFLFQLVKEKTDTQVFETIQVTAVNNQAECVKIIGQDASKKLVNFQSKIVIGADGTNGVCAKQLSHFKMDKKHHCGAVRAYVKGIAGLEKTTNEFYLIKKFTPGYFWIFPLENGLANIGFGMISDKISQRRLNLKNTLEEIISSYPPLLNRFENAEIIGKIKGFGLPLGSRFAPISGNRFMLAGDAASLVDPLQGHGIDKAMLSGKLAAEQAMISLEQGDFKAHFIKNYDDRVYKELGGEFRRNYWILILLSKFPFLMNIITRLAQNAFMKSILQRFT